jgi:hypothetical protein
VKPDARRLTGHELEAELGRPGWRRSTGLAGGEHYRRQQDHLVVTREGGLTVGRIHKDRLDPATHPIGHLVIDGGPLLVGWFLLGLATGRVLRP